VDPFLDRDDDRTGAAAMSIVLLSISFTVLVLLRIVAGARPNVEERPRDIVLLGSTLIRYVTLAYIGVMLGRPGLDHPVADIQPGFRSVWSWITRRRRSRRWTVAGVVAVVVPFERGLRRASPRCCSRAAGSRRAALQSIVDCIAVSPIIVVWR